MEIVLGIGEGPQWECVFTPPSSIMKANQLGWQRHVLQEDSQSTKPNEPQLEIRKRRGRAMSRLWMRMKEKDGGKRVVKQP